MPSVSSGPSEMLSVVALLGAALFVSACEEPAAPPAAAAPPPVTVSKPLQKEIREWDEYTGRFEAVAQVELRARVSGYLQSIHFTDGDTVKKDDLLFVIDPRPFERALEQAQAEEAQAKTRLEFAQREVKRAQPLLERQTISEQVYDERLKEQREAESGLKAAEARRRSAQLDVEFTQVRAPMDGRASRHLISVGNYVTGGSASGTLLTTIVSLDPIHFYFDVSERAHLKYVRLANSGARPSSRVTANPVFLSLKDEPTFTHKGKMDFVDNRLDSATGTMRGRALFNNRDGVFSPGMFARIRLLGSGKYNALMLPDPAIGTDQSNRFVYTVDDKGKVAYRPVRLGPLVDGLRVVREGVGPDDWVIIGGLQRARTGGTVSPKRSTITSPAEATAKTATTQP